MRSLKKNKQPFYYVTYDAEKKVYDRDEDGNIKYIEIDGEKIPVEIGTEPGYSDPVLFYANISAAMCRLMCSEVALIIPGQYLLAIWIARLPS